HAGFTTRLLAAVLLMVVLGLGAAGVCFHGANAAGDPLAENPPAGQKPPEISKPATQGQVPALPKDPREPPAKKTPLEQENNAEAESDLDKLHGNWRVISSQVGDEIATQEEIKKRKITVKGSRIIYEYGNEQK